MSTFYFETDAPEPCPIAFGGDAAVLVHFQSLAFSTRYGSQHPLSVLALYLRGEYKVNLDPLTTFADRDVEEEADQRELDRVWQDAAPLAASIRATLAALAADDPRIPPLIEGVPDLVARLEDLLAMTEWAAAKSARVRMTFEL